MENMTRVRYADKPTVEAHAWIDAAPEVVWSLVADIELMPTLSDELQSVEWLAPSTGPAVGATFRGHNRQGSGQWSTVSTIVAYDPDREFTWAVGNVDNPAAVWKFTLCPQRGGTLLTQSAQIGPGRSAVSAVIDSHPEREHAIVSGRLRNFQQGMIRNLAAIKSTVETR
ncbi:SRPBCC family protein [soil metagenome]